MTKVEQDNLTPLLDSLREARNRTVALVSDLDEEQMIGPRMEIVNPLRWELGHVAWFQEFWLLRHLLGRSPTLSTGDVLFDSAKVAHETRWDLPLLSKADTIAYKQKILDRVFAEYHPDAQPGKLPKDAAYFLSLALFHEDMHSEAITYTRQTLGYSAPNFSQTTTLQDSQPNEKLGDAFVPGGTFALGNANDQAFVFDNELRAHEATVAPFSISRTAVSNGEFAAFVDDRGYERREFWSDAGWAWREANDAKHPVYWISENGKWLRRKFDQLEPLEESLPVLHVNWYEAEAFCRWAQRRLPTEAEWEMAASAEPLNNDGISDRKRKFPWGDEPPNPQRANLDWQAMGLIDVRSLPDGDSAFGCRQMIGNVWEWTASDFLPFPGFVAGAYKEYSAPWFGDHKVLRGGCWTTRSRLINNTYRNFYKPDRRDVWAGFRTCALEA